MANFFEKAKDSAKDLEESIIGPDYKYYEFIKEPAAMGMSSEGSISAITNDISGIINYVTLLSAGGGGASKTGAALGNKFFLETGAKCKDKASGESVTRSLYVNNVPDGSIPFISSGMGIRMDSMKGLIPGTLSNLAQINPMQIFGAFMEGTTPECQAITMETIDVNNIKSQKTAYVTTNDIANMNAAWFPGGKKPATGKEGFTNIGANIGTNIGANIGANIGTNAAKIDYSLMPNDVLAKLYYSSLGLLLLYILMRVFRR